MNVSGIRNYQQNNSSRPNFTAVAIKTIEFPFEISKTMKYGLDKISRQAGKNFKTGLNPEGEYITYKLSETSDGFREDWAYVKSYIERVQDRGDTPVRDLYRVPNGEALKDIRRFDVKCRSKFKPPKVYKVTGGTYLR